MATSSSFYKNNETDVIWWVDDPEDIGTLRFSFDKKKIYYFFQDYKTLPPDLKAIFDRENPELARFYN